MNNYQLTELSAEYAEEIMRECGGDMDAASDLAWQYADGSEHVIYYHKAHAICQHCDTSLGEDMLEDIGSNADTYDSKAVEIAFCELYSRIMEELGKVEIEEAA